MTTGTLALIILAAIFGQLLAVVLVGWYRRRRSCQDQGEGAAVTSPTQASAARAAFPGPAWDGFREFIVQRRVYEDASRSVCSFYLVPLDKGPLPAFRPGQFLTFSLSIEDPRTHEPRNVIRCYSLSDRPRPDYYRVSIKRVPAPADRPELPAGVSSNFFHEHVAEGDHLQVKAPSGHFYLVEDESLPLVLIAGGIGVTPMLSILNAILETGAQRDVWLYYGVRNGAEHILKEQLQSLAKEYANFHLHVCYSDPGEGDEKHVDYQHRGRIDIALLQSTLTQERYQFYICGPRPMMESLVPGLETWGVATSDIHYESFGPASLTRRIQPDGQALGATPLTVTFSRSGKQLGWTPNAGSLLELAEANGIAVPSGCRAGSCGTCQTTLLSGEVEYSQQPDADIEPGCCLLCIAMPKVDLTLDA